jgi:hypothetical protein
MRGNIVLADTAPRANLACPELRGEGRIVSFVAVVHGDHLTFNGVEYYRDGAESVLLGTYGEKRAPAPRREHVEARGRIPAARLVVRSSAAVEVDGERSRGDVDLEALRSGARKLVSLEMLLPDVKFAVNGAPNVLRSLKSYGWEARVVHQVIAILEPTLAEALARASGFRVGGDDGADALTVTVGATTVSLPAGSTYGYLLCRPEWNRSRTGVERFVDEPWGLE